MRKRMRLEDDVGDVKEEVEEDALPVVVLYWNSLHS